jgi:hypothetical protein
LSAAEHSELVEEFAVPSDLDGVRGLARRVLEHGARVRHFPVVEPAIWRTGWADLRTLRVPAASRAHRVVATQLNDINARGSIVGDVYGLAAKDFSKLQRVYPVLWTCPFGR